jgi:hypothetical protein
MLDLSVGQLVRNEERLGLKPVRLNSRLIRYHAVEALAALETRGFIKK